MERNLYKFILKYSLSEQIKLIILIVASYPVIYTGFVIPKVIINDALQGGPGVRRLLGYEFSQLNYLVLLCFSFLIVVLISGLVKFVVNVYRGAVGERLLRRLRYQLVSRVMRFPLSAFRKVPQGEVISMVTLEVEKLGKFMGESFSLPAFQGGVLLTSFTFLMIENYIMGLAAMGLYPIQIYFIPKLQHKVNRLEADRIQLVRKISARIGETINGIQDIHSHDATQFELADYSNRLGTIFYVRLEIFQKKFFIKFFNNFMAQLGPFMFYLGGGYFVISGSLSVGGLVAMLSAYSVMYAPWKELLNYYQQSEEARIKYLQVVSQFEPAGILDEEKISSDQVIEETFQGDLVANGLGYEDENENRILASLSFRLDLSRHTAIIGPPGSGKAALSMILARLLDHSSGQLKIDRFDARQFSESITGRKIAYVGKGSHIFSGTLGDNLFFGLKHRPVTSPELSGKEKAQREKFHSESEISGNTTYDIHSDWIDYEAAGVENFPQLVQELHRVLGIVHMDEEVYHFGLSRTIDPDNEEETSYKILAARKTLTHKLDDFSAARFIEQFDPDSYNSNASLIENLMFGTPTGDEFVQEDIGKNKYLRGVLEKAELMDDLEIVGYKIASFMVEVFSDLDDTNQSYQQFSFLNIDDLPLFKKICNRFESPGKAGMDVESKHLLIGLSFKLIPAKHRLGLIDDPLQRKILQAREIFRNDLPDRLRHAIDFFDPEKYNAASTIQDNILFGKMVYGEANAQKRVGELLREVIEEQGLFEAVIRAGLSIKVGIGGILLSSSLHQKVVLARGLIKRPDFLVLYQALNDLEAPERLRILELLKAELKGKGMIAVLKFPSMAQYFDRILVLRNGELLEQGTYKELNTTGTYFSELVKSEKA